MSVLKICIFLCLDFVELFCRIFNVIALDVGYNIFSVTPLVASFAIGAFVFLLKHSFGRGVD